MAKPQNRPGAASVPVSQGAGTASPGPHSPEAASGHAPPATPPGSSWAALTWDDLGRWTSPETLVRGRDYHRAGQARHLRRTPAGELLATVTGTADYAVRIALRPADDPPPLTAVCSCPVGTDCKHAVAAVLTYLQLLAAGKTIPLAGPDDRRLTILEDVLAGRPTGELPPDAPAPDQDQDGPGEEEGGDEEDESGDADTRDEHDPDDDLRPPAGSRRSRTVSPRASSQVSPDDEIRAELNRRSHGELVELLCTVARRDPTLARELHEQAALRGSGVGRLLTQVRRDLQAWRAAHDDDDWEETAVPLADLERCRRRLERLRELGAADVLVELGPDLVETASGLIEHSSDHDEDTAGALARCLEPVFRAVLTSRLSGAERLLFLLDTELRDSFDLVDGPGQSVLDAARPEDWSALAEILRAQLADAGPPDRRTEFLREFGRDVLVEELVRALTRAGRADEVRPLLEAETPVTGNYDRIVSYLLTQGDLAAAEWWACAGIPAATASGGDQPVESLVEALRTIAERQGRWDLVAAHAAETFFGGQATAETFRDLVTAAERAGVGEPVRAAARRFLETGTPPYEVWPPPAGRPRSTPTRGRAAAGVSPKTFLPATGPVSVAPAGALPRVEVSPAWPLPVPVELAMVRLADGGFQRWSGPGQPSPGPRYDVLVEIAIQENRPEEVLTWYDQRPASAPAPAWGAFPGPDPADLDDRVAAAVASTHPERALTIYRQGLDDALPQAHQAAYVQAAGYLRRLRPVYAALGRPEEWDALVTSIREQYRRRPRFLEELDTVHGGPIVSAWARQTSPSGKRS